MIDLMPYQSSSKKAHHVSYSNIQIVHPKPFDLYSQYRHPDDPFPEIEDERYKRGIKKKAKRLKKSKRSK